MKIAIVGANSFLSQVLLNKLVDSHSLIQVYHKKKDKLNKCISSQQIDDFLKEKPIVDYVYFIASYINFDEKAESIHKIYKTNVALLKMISDTFTNAKIINTSSVSVYKNINSVINEDTILEPASSYGMSKLWAELIVKKHKSGGCNVRISSIFGENMKMNTFLPIIIKQAIENNSIEIYGKGDRKQNYIHVNDVAEVLVKALSLDKDYNLLAVGSKSYSNLEIANFIKEILPKTKIVFFSKDTTPSFFYDNSKTNMILGLLPNTNFKEKLRNTILWIQKQY
ncbi:NAD-dependent epimerase/dehydratase family protein [Aquimarina agarilytica]|uniref:NAD-dependent epimerase/dehydratase family protein n=1 Tax=Aquimarina agarilytica TaxID=1087449 RepID=UPI000287D42A|nr:NAD(P)-dependent oxidoreductase [Aquimarina agarilytica]